MNTAIVVFGPPLPGRDLLAHALALRAPRGTEVIVDDLRSADERIRLAAALAAAGTRAVFVAREPCENEAWREVFHHYAGMPLRLADLRWQGYLDDLAQRDPAAGEVGPLIVLRGVEPLETALSSIATLIGTGELRAAETSRVLVVDDDPAQVELVAEALRLLGCEVATAGTAEEALALARQRTFDLVISDQRMPGAAGTDLAAELSSVQPGVRVAIVTGFPDQTAAELPRGPHVDLVLAKPVGIVDLVRVLDEMSRH